jgi:ATP-dependent helicase/DNAse subunit B
MFINSISASKSDVIDQCLLKFYLKYVLRLPGFGSQNGEALNFGSFIHKVLELGYRDSDLKSLMKIALSEKKTYKIPFRENDRTKACLENFLSWNQKMGETLSTEMVVTVPLDAERDINFNGVIDRVIKGNAGGYLVIDYKTSKREKKKKDLLLDKQLMGYAYAIHILYNVPISDIHCAHYYPLTNNFVSVSFSKFQIEMWKKREIDKVWRIRKKTKDEFPAQRNIFCDWCEFQPMCSKFNSEAIVTCKMNEQVALRDKMKEEKKLKELLEKESNKQPNNDSSNKPV